MRLISFLFNFFNIIGNAQSRYLRSGKVGKIIIFFVHLILSAAAVFLGYLTFVLFGKASAETGVASIIWIILMVIVAICAVVMALQLALIFISTAMVAFSSKARKRAEEKIRNKEERRAKKENKKRLKALKKSNNEVTKTEKDENSSNKNKDDLKNVDESNPDNDIESKINEKLKSSQKLDIAMGVLHILLLVALGVGVLLLFLNVKI